MSQYNVTRDIRKLAEEAEKDKNLNSTVTTAGLGLGGGFVASQTGGSATNQPRPSNLTIQANEAQARANQVNLDRSTNQYRSNVNLNQLDPAKNVNINNPNQFKQSVTKNVIDATVNPPKFTAGPRPDYRPGAGEAKPTPTKKIPITPQGSPTLDAKGNPLRLPKDNVVKNIVGSTLSGIGNVADKAFKIAPLIIPDTELGDIEADRMVGMGYTAEQMEKYRRGEDPGPLFDPEYMLGPISYADTIPYSERSDVEKQILANREAGLPLLQGTNTFNQPQMVDQSEARGQKQNMLQGKDSLGTATPDLPSYQTNFMERIENKEPITDTEFQRAQKFALSKGMVFDPKEGYSKADFFGQMYKGQTIGQFLRGEDAPEGFTDVIKETADPRIESRRAYEQASREREERLANRPDFMEAVPDKPEGELSLGDYRNLARAEGFKGSAQIAQAKLLMKEAKEKDKMTPYQKASLQRGLASDAESLRRYEETKQFNLEKHEESIRQYEEGIKSDKDKQVLKDLETRARVNKLTVDTDAKLAEAGITEVPEGDYSDKAMKDYLNVAERLGYVYDFKTGVFTEDKFGGRPIDEKTFREELEPPLSQTDYGKALIYIESQKKSK
jgi:tetratricopeptide (TPR) repeat protein